jgi:hypothetical protein
VGRGLHGAVLIVWFDVPPEREVDHVATSGWRCDCDHGVGSSGFANDHLPEKADQSRTDRETRSWHHNSIDRLPPTTPRNTL